MVYQHAQEAARGGEQGSGFLSDDGPAGHPAGAACFVCVVFFCTGSLAAARVVAVLAAVGVRSITSGRGSKNSEKTARKSCLPPAACPRGDDDDVLRVLLLWLKFLKSSTWTQNRVLQKQRLDGRKQNNMCTAVSTRKGTVPTSCGVPSCITCNEIILGTCPWYIHTHLRTPEKYQD